ncbi:MAG: NAD-dependent epimerase/dehydratase family protein [Elusimicrobia bacterium]|nr:NAD-dependent epimerase/dehydratase family protein [Elusimicrobiota bacterium]
MRAFVTGGVGFIGSNLCHRLVNEGWQVTAYDNLLLGRVEFIRHLLGNPKFKFIKKDLLNHLDLLQAIRGHDFVFHLACNSDISKGTQETDTDLKLGTIATYNVLEAMRLAGIKKIIFASTSAIYGEAHKTPTPENYGPLLPISLYGAGKLAGEGLITAFSHCYGMKAWIYRFANVIGKNGTHGALVDFIAKLKANPNKLLILGDGRQRKPYLHVSDCVDGMLFGLRHADKSVNVFNLTPKDQAGVNQIARSIVKQMGLDRVRFDYTGESRGWPGDVARVLLDGRGMKKIGWQPKLNSQQAIQKAVSELLG